MWNLDSDRPIYVQLVERLQIQIVSGQYAPGQKLPSVRELAAAVAVNPNTMQKALAELEKEGLVMALRASGRIVTEDMEMIRATRNQLAKEQIQEFIDKMEKLGFNKKEIVTLLEQMEEKE